MKVIHVHGNRWFQKVYGNTYHKVQVFIDGKFVWLSPITYGYGSQFTETAAKFLEENGYLIRESYSSGGKQTLMAACDAQGIALGLTVSDVGREKDL